MPLPAPPPPPPVWPTENTTTRVEPRKRPKPRPRPAAASPRPPASAVTYPEKDSENALLRIRCNLPHPSEPIPRDARPLVPPDPTRRPAISSDPASRVMLDDPSARADPAYHFWILFSPDSPHRARYPTHPHPSGMQQQQILQGAVPMMAQGQHMMQMQNQMMQYGMQPGMLMGANGVVFPMMQDQGMYSALSKRERDIEAQSEPTGGGGQPVEKRFRAQPRASMPMSHETPLLHKKPRGRPPNNRVSKIITNRQSSEPILQRSPRVPRPLPPCVADSPHIPPPAPGSDRAPPMPCKTPARARGIGHAPARKRLHRHNCNHPIRGISLAFLSTVRPFSPAGLPVVATPTHILKCGTGNPPCRRRRLFEWRKGAPSASAPVNLYTPV